MELAWLDTNKGAGVGSVGHGFGIGKAFNSDGLSFITSLQLFLASLKQAMARTYLSQPSHHSSEHQCHGSPRAPQRRTEKTG